MSLYLIKAQLNFTSKWSLPKWPCTLTNTIRTALYKIFINETLMQCANHSSVYIDINKTLICGLWELKTKEKSSWVIPKVVAVANGSGRLQELSLPRLRHSSNRVSLRLELVAYKTGPKEGFNGTVEEVQHDDNLWSLFLELKNPIGGWKLYVLKVDVMCCLHSSKSSKEKRLTPLFLC